MEAFSFTPCFRSLSEKRVQRLLRKTFGPYLPSNEFFNRVEWFLYPQFSRFLIFPTDSFSEVIRSEHKTSNRFNGNNILDSSPCGLRVDWSYVRVFSWFALQMNHENQTTKSHEPGITKRHKGSTDESSMLLPFQRFLKLDLDSEATRLKPGENKKRSGHANHHRSRGRFLRSGHRLLPHQTWAQSQ